MYNTRVGNLRSDDDMQGRRKQYGWKEEMEVEKEIGKG